MADDITKTEAENMMKEAVAGPVSAVSNKMAPVLLLGRDAILNAMDLKSEDVDVPEWGGVIRVRGLKGIERDEFEASIVSTDSKGQTHVEAKQMRARLCSLTMIDDNGMRLFEESDVADLGQKSAAALERVFDVAMRLAGMSKDEVENLGKDSEKTPSTDSDSV